MLYVLLHFNFFRIPVEGLVEVWDYNYHHDFPEKVTTIKGPMTWPKVARLYLVESLGDIFCVLDF